VPELPPVPVGLIEPALHAAASIAAAMAIARTADCAFIEWSPCKRGELSGASEGGTASSGLLVIRHLPEYAM
jgi:hypothetical protein